MLVEVAFPIPLHRTFHYRLAGDLPAPGVRVRAPFGPRKLPGVVVGSAQEGSVNIPPERIREIEAVLDAVPVYGPELMPLARLISAAWLSPLGQVLSAMLPADASSADE